MRAISILKNIAAERINVIRYQADKKYINVLFLLSVLSEARRIAHRRFTNDRSIVRNQFARSLAGSP